METTREESRGASSARHGVVYGRWHALGRGAGPDLGAAEGETGASPSEEAGTQTQKYALRAAKDRRVKRGRKMAGNLPGGRLDPVPSSRNPAYQRGTPGGGLLRTLLGGDDGSPGPGPSGPGRQGSEDGRCHPPVGEPREAGLRRDDGCGDPPEGRTAGMESPDVRALRELRDRRSHGTRKGKASEAGGTRADRSKGTVKPGPNRDGVKPIRC